jgi:hypothetical protein
MPWIQITKSSILQSFIRCCTSQLNPAFYVALARARKSLHILTALQSGGATQPSNFIDNVPEENVDFSKYTKTAGSNEFFEGLRGFTDYLERLNKSASRRR